MTSAIDIWCNIFTPAGLKKYYADVEEMAVIFQGKLAGHGRHGQVQQQATAPGEVEFHQEPLRRRVGTRLHPGRTNQTRETVAHIVVVIDNENNWTRIARLAHDAPLPCLAHGSFRTHADRLGIFLRTRWFTQCTAVSLAGAWRD